MYMHHLRPFLVRHQARFDQIVGFLYGEMVKPVSPLFSGVLNVFCDLDKEIQHFMHLVCKIVEGRWLYFPSPSSKQLWFCLTVKLLKNVKQENFASFLIFSYECCLCGL